MNIEKLKHELETINCLPMTPTEISKLWDLDYLWHRMMLGKIDPEQRLEIERSFGWAHMKRRLFEERSK